LVVVPFGFRVGEDGALAPDEAEQAVIAQARSLRADEVDPIGWTGIGVT
jgi:hypothetical protein